MTAAIDLSSLFQPLPAPAAVPGNPPAATVTPNSIYDVQVGAVCWIWNRRQWRPADVIDFQRSQGVAIVQTRREGWILRCSLPSLLRVPSPWR